MILVIVNWVANLLSSANINDSRNGMCAVNCLSGGSAHFGRRANFWRFRCQENPKFQSPSFQDTHTRAHFFQQRKCHTSQTGTASLICKKFRWIFLSFSNWHFKHGNEQVARTDHFESSDATSQNFPPTWIGHAECMGVNQPKRWLYEVLLYHLVAGAFQIKSHLWEGMIRDVWLAWRAGRAWVLVKPLLG